MAEERFFSMFTEELRESVEALIPPKSLSSWARSLYLSKWNPCSLASDPYCAVVACDGSSCESSFSGGLTAWVARAVAHIYAKDGPIVTMPEVAVHVGYRLKGQSLFMKALELRALRNAVEKALHDHGKVFAIFDGSLYLTLFHHSPQLEAMAWLIDRYLTELTALLKICQDGDVSVLGLSKDSDISYLRARILLDELLLADASIGKELAIRGRSAKRMAERLRDGIKALPKDHLLGKYLEEFELEISDEGLYGEIAIEPGFTTPLLLAPQTNFFTEEAERGTKGWWDSTFRKRLEYSEKMPSLISVLDSFYARPPIAVFYWKPRPESGVYRVDVPSVLLGYDGRCGDLSEDTFIDERGLEPTQRLVGNINWLSHEPYVMDPLMEVDAVVRLDRALYKQAYEPVIMEELRRRGFRVNLRKRSLRDFIMRGY